MGVFYAQYPASASAGANPSVGPVGVTAPTAATEIAGVGPTGNLTPVSTDASGNINVDVHDGVGNSISSVGGALNVNVTGTVTPAGGATAANQVLEITQLTNIDTATTALNVRTAGSLTPVNYDEVDLTYILVGNGTGQIGTAVYKLATATVRTLTLTYDASNRLSTVVAS